MIGAKFVAAVLTVAIAALGFGVGAVGPRGAAEAAVIEFDVRLTGAAETPPVTSPGSANAHFKFDDVTRELSYTLTVQGYSAEIVNAAHIHRGLPGVAGPLIYTLADKGFLSISGKVTLTPDDAVALRSGQLYVDVHSTTFPNGFARGQMIIAPIGRGPGPQFGPGFNPQGGPGQPFVQPGGPRPQGPQGIQPNQRGNRGGHRGTHRHHDGPPRQFNFRGGPGAPGGPLR